MSRLEDSSIVFRKQNLAKNQYNINDPYNASHSNALSNGDDKGKGEMNGDAGSATDIKTREKLVAKNKFNRNKEYNSATA
jgi:hypothetical protein